MRALLMLCAAALALTGCATSRSGDVYSREQARQVHTVERGVIETLRPIQIEGTSGAVGGVSGAVIGGVAGSTVGGGRGTTLATVAGALAGGLIGAAIEEGATKKQGLEMIVRLDNGQTIAVVQETQEGDSFSVGERVNVLTRNGVARVTSIANTPTSYVAPAAAPAQAPESAY